MVLDHLLSCKIGKQAVDSVTVEIGTFKALAASEQRQLWKRGHCVEGGYSLQM